ncbi:MAG: hypothetical protein KJT01_10885 [Gemmatimonadetes bacterium]|nr:hypothetical protein [Gemmatimonadota bacterium]
MALPFAGLRLKRPGLALGALALALAACGKESTAPVKIATQNVTTTFNGSVAQAIAGRSVSIPGAAGLVAPAAPNQNLGLTFGGTATAPTATGTVTTSAGATTGSFTANVTFGSCTFTFTSVTGNLGITVGQSIRVNPCALNLVTAGQAVGTTNNTNATVSFGNFLSAPIPVQVQVSENGTVTVNNQTVGQVSTGNSSS